VHFPVALWLVATFFDVLGWRREDVFYRQAARWLLWLGLLGAAVSIALGWVDLIAAESQGVGTALLLRHRVHSVLAYTATATYLATALWRGRRAQPLAAGMLALSLLGAVLVAATAFLGGEMRQVM
jgi:uncharacterized membrane protein